MSKNFSSGRSLSVNLSKNKVFKDASEPFRAVCAVMMTSEIYTFLTFPNI